MQNRRRGIGGQIRQARYRHGDRGRAYPQCVVIVGRGVRPEPIPRAGRRSCRNYRRLAPSAANRLNLS